MQLNLILQITNTKVADFDTGIRVGTLTVLQKLHKPTLQQVFFKYRVTHQKYLLIK